MEKAQQRNWHPPDGFILGLWTLITLVFFKTYGRDIKRYAGCCQFFSSEDGFLELVKWILVVEGGMNSWPGSMGLVKLMVSVVISTLRTLPKKSVMRTLPGSLRNRSTQE
ncbi:hypothetical protein CRUP_008148 [Coryphaenoides rupestris]|nr:hypothetical protein CRUP_008148 [Coryphaenoides rupestris]